MKKSAGILLYRKKDSNIEVLLVHPGGPFWKNKDLGCWSIPKGEFTEEPIIEAAIREFKEETGFTVAGDFLDLGNIKYSNGKIVYAFALEGDLDAQKIKSNTFEMEWPPKSGKVALIEEVDKGEWFNLSVALDKIIKPQTHFILELAKRLSVTVSKNIIEQPNLL